MGPTLGLVFNYVSCGSNWLFFPMFLPPLPPLVSFYPPSLPNPRDTAHPVIADMTTTMIMTFY
ncbi:hypothetical protein BDR06DRAFT_946496, partial [Suillus hirtellus]